MRVGISIAIIAATAGTATPVLTINNVALVGLGGAMSGAIQSGDARGAAWGAVSALAFYGIGSYFEGAQWAKVAGEGASGVAKTGLNFGGYASKVLAHGVTGGALQHLQGGKFGSGFMSAGITQAASGYLDIIDHSNPDFSTQRVVAAAVLGGTVSDLTGGKFGHGAVTAAFSRAFNDEVGRSRGKKERVLSRGEI